MKNTLHHKWLGLGLLAFFLTISAIDCYAQNEAKTPVERWGRLQVLNGQLSAADGSPVQLRGISLYDSTNYGELASLANQKWLRDDWQATVFRAAMYTNLDNKFIGAGAYPAEFAIIQAAIDAGLYVIVDWHITTDADPRIHQEEAKDFFSQVATRFGKFPNIIYEICNEPSGASVTWTEAIKPYAMALIPIIRAIDPASIILVGTPEWSQHPEVAVSEPLPFGNLMYVLHYYAGTHDQSLFLSRIDAAQAAGAGVFISEWGVSNAQAKGGIFPAKSLEWSEQLDKRQLSWAVWCLSYKVGESSSLLKPLASQNGNWLPGELTEGGLLVRSLLRRENGGPILADGFESSNLLVSGWIRDSAMLDRNIAHTGTNAIRFEGKTSLTKTLNVQNCSDLTIDLWYKAVALTNRDKLLLEYSKDGNNWQILATISRPQVSQDWQNWVTALPQPYPGDDAYQFRLRSDFSSKQAKFWMDDVLISAIRQ